jgi:hypothetical protein
MYIDLCKYFTLQLHRHCISFMVHSHCDMQYIGESEQLLHRRMNGHQSDCDRKSDLLFSCYLR